GVQTCALPISPSERALLAGIRRLHAPPSRAPAPPYTHTHTVIHARTPAKTPPATLGKHHAVVQSRSHTTPSSSRAATPRPDLRPRGATPSDARHHQLSTRCQFDTPRTESIPGGTSPRPKCRMTRCTAADARRGGADQGAARRGLTGTGRWG